MPHNRLFLIDGHGLCYRAFYAVKALTNSKGTPTNAIYGFCNILHKLLHDLKPTHIAVCFDVSKITRRHEKFPAYKANRQAMPDELRVQIDTIHAVIRALRIPIIEQQGYEADDVMATLAKKFVSSSTEAIIVTEDKDMGQMVEGAIKIYSPRLEKYIEAGDVLAKFGVLPNQITDYIALAGDASDNIPGVKGVGEVTAQKLLKEYGSVEGIYQHLPSMKPSKIKEKLEASKQDAFLSKELATLHTDLDLPFTLDDLRHQDPDHEALLKLYQELEFKRFIAELTGDSKSQTGPVVVKELLRLLLSAGNNEPHIVFDLKSCLKDGLILASDLTKAPVFDLAIADFLLIGNPNKPDINLARETQEGMVECWKNQSILLVNDGLDLLYQQIELPLAQVLYRVEKHGITVDVSVLNTLSAQCAGKIVTIEQDLYKMAGVEFNLNSPKQLSEILFEKLKLPVIKKTKTGFSTDEEVLNRLAEKHPLPALILEYRQLAKLKSTYLDALPALVNPKTGRIHTTFNQLGAETGRLSSINPNLQNIPIRTDLGRQIRLAFTARNKDHLLLSADYSQIELRVLAHLANDPALRKAFDDNQDIHRYTASLMFDVPLNEVDDKMRYAAKRVNFGIIYGISAYGLSKDLEVSISQAQEFIDKYFLRYPKVHDFMETEIQKARDQGYVTTLFGRRRYLPEIHNRNMAIRQFAERQAINTPVQGTAADMIKLAMVNIDQELCRDLSLGEMVLTVHDELVFDVPATKIEKVISIVKSAMESVMSLSVPLVVSVKSGHNWLEMK